MTEIKEQKTEKVHCRNCKKLTNHKVLHAVTIDESDIEDEIWASTEYKTLQCMGCEEVCLLEEFSSSENYDYNTNSMDIDRKVYPESSYHDRETLEGIHHLPSAIQKIYIETVMAFNHNQPILAGAGLRTIVEAICLNKEILKGKLNKKIDKLFSMGFMTKNECDLLHLNRSIGNISTHEVKRVSEDELETGLEIIEGILQNAYILPKKAEWIELSQGRKRL